MNKLLSGISLLIISPLALAHPGHGLDNAYSGFMHPLTGWDHLLVMLAVGLWAGKLGGNMRWQLPVTFISMMAIGACLSMAGLAWNGLETAISASVMAMGLLLLITAPLKTSIRIGLIAIFALLHGMAHGVELFNQSKIGAIGGMLIATALLHLVGISLSSERLRLPKMIYTFMGLIMLSAGGFLLIS